MSKSQRRQNRRVTSYVTRMSHEMTCYIASWPDLGPDSCKELRKSWRRLKKVLDARITDRQRQILENLAAQCYHMAMKGAATPEDRAKVHKAALAANPQFPRLLNSLYRNYQ